MERDLITRQSFSPRELARMHGLCPHTVYRAIAVGKLRATRIGRVLRICKADADSLFANGISTERG